MYRLIKSFLFTLLISSSFLLSVPSMALESSKHKLFDDVLQKYVVSGQVNYAGIQNDSRFQQYLDYLATANPDQMRSKDEQLAFWINAYNALAIKGIIDGKSPRKLLGRYKFFISTKYDLAGNKTSLDDLEKKIIIPFDEPLIHFAIVCASASCPKLSSKAYTEDNLYEMMKSNVKAFVNNSFKNKLSKEDKTIRISKIFDWFKKDFAAKAGSVQQYIAPYIDDPELAEKLRQDSFKVKYLKYNWSLNGTSPNK